MSANASPTRGERTDESPSLNGRGKGEDDYVNLLNSFAVVRKHRAGPIPKKPFDPINGGILSFIVWSHTVSIRVRLSWVFLDNGE
jgi:hypothetical protein